MDSPALRDLAGRVRGDGLAVAGGISLEAVLGRIGRQLERQEKAERELSRAVAPVVLPAVTLLTAGGVLAYDAAQQQLGPEDGQVWDVRRLTVAGLTAQGGAAASANGSVTTPGAGAAIAAIAAGSYVPGTYMVYWTVALAGTPGAADADNFRLQLGSTALEVSVNPGAAGEYSQPVYGPLVTRGSSAVQVKAIGAGAAGAVYEATISIVPVADDQVSLYREIGGAGGGNPQNLLWTFTAAAPTWTPGRGLILRSPETLLLAGTGLAAPQVTLSGEVIAVGHEWLARYLM